jgi:hypothetical protein
MRFSSLAALALCAAACSSTHTHPPGDAGADAVAGDAGDVDATATPDLGGDAATPDAGDAGTPDGGGTDLGPPDTGAPPPDLGAFFDIHIDSATLWTCNCHHGCGPGIDGSISVVVTNTDTVARTIQIVDVRLVPVGGGTTLVASALGYFTVMGTDVDHMYTVAGGSMEYRNVVPYIDLSRTMPGNYRVEVLVRVDGVNVTLSLDTFITTMPTVGCP